MYKKKLEKTDLVLPVEKSSNLHVYHLFTVFHPHSKKIINSLKKKNIQIRVIYPYPIHNMNGFKHLNFNKKYLQNANKISKNIFCLPLYPDLSNKNVNIVCEEIIKILKNLKNKN